MSEDEITEEEWMLVEARLESMPEDYQLGFLCQLFTKGKLMVEVRNRTRVGKDYAKMQLGMVRWLVRQSKVV